MKIFIGIDVPDDWEYRLDMQSIVEAEVKADRWSWHKDTPQKATIKSMVDRFLGWALPEDFAPDCGISFKRYPGSQPIGTNLFSADQARAMFEYCSVKPQQEESHSPWLESFSDCDDNYLYRGILKKHTLEWTDAWDCKHSCTPEYAIETLKRFFNEWPGGFEEIEACLKSSGEYATRLKEEIDRNGKNGKIMLDAALDESRQLREELGRMRSSLSRIVRTIAAEGVVAVKAV